MMLKKWTYLLLLFCLLVGTAYSQDVPGDPQWGGWYDRDWNKLGNWVEDGNDLIELPQPDEKVKLNCSWGSPGPVIDGNVEVGEIFMGEADSDPTIKQTLDVVDGGNLQVNGQFLIGTAPGNISTVTVEEGSILSTDSHIWLGFNGPGPNMPRSHGNLIVDGGTVDIGDGVFSIGSWQGGSGHVELKSGTIYSHGWPYMGTTDANGLGTMNIEEGTFIQQNYYLEENNPDHIPYWIDHGLITAYGGEGEVLTEWNGSQTILTAVLPLFEIDDITITNASPAESNDFALENMFEIGANNDVNETIFATDPNGAGAVYYVNFETERPVKVESLNLTMNHDGEPNYARAVSDFKLLAKTNGASSYNKVIYHQPISVPYNGVFELDADIKLPVAAQEYRLEFVGHHSSGPRIREINASGEFADGTQTGSVWDANNLRVTNHTSTLGWPSDLFKEGTEYEAIFHDGISSDPNLMLEPDVYYIEWKTDNAVALEELAYRIEHDTFDKNDPCEPNEPLRSVDHLAIKAKSLGSSSYDTVLYEEDIPVPYGSNEVVFTDSKEFGTPVRAQYFRAEFTGHFENSGPRIRDIDGFGVTLQPSLTDFTGDYAVNFSDYSIFAGDWGQDNTDVAVKEIDDFESYSSMPEGGWDLEYADYYSTFSLITDEAQAHSGSKALRWNYDVYFSGGTAEGGVTKVLENPIDLTNYDQIRLWVKRHQDNGEATVLELRFQDSEGNMVLNAGGTSITEPNGVWDEWVLDIEPHPSLSSLMASELNIHVWKDSDITGGTGTVDIDDIRLYPECVSPEYDFTGDCIVDEQDLIYITEEWLNQGY